MRALDNAPAQQALPIGEPIATPPRRRGMKLEHVRKVDARRELLRHGFWPCGIGPTDPETWVDRQLKRRFCFRTEGPALVRLVEITT